MSSYVVNAKVIYSALISGKSDYIDLAIVHRLYLPNFGMTELQQYQQVIFEKKRQRPEELKQYTLALFRKITIVPNLLISLHNYRSAFELCKDIDDKDTANVALSLELNHSLPTRDKPLAVGLRAKGFTNVVLLDELFAQTDDTDTDSTN